MTENGGDLVLSTRTGILPTPETSDLCGEVARILLAIWIQAEKPVFLLSILHDIDKCMCIWS